MFSMFSPDSKIMQVLARFADLVILNGLYLITCIPVFTIGAANTALYNVCFRMLREEGGVVKPYFRAFWENFKQATVLWLLLLFIGVPAYLYFDKFYHFESILRYGYVLFVSILMLTILVGGFVFPWLSRFQNNVPTTLRNAMLLSIGHLPKALVILMVNVLPFGLWIVNYDLFLRVSFLWISLYFAAGAYFNANLLRSVFAPYISEEA